MTFGFNPANKDQSEAARVAMNAAPGRGRPDAAHNGLAAVTGVS